MDDLQGKASELMKKILTVGVGAIFLTEESLRGLVSEFKLPKELLSAILESAGKTKNDFLQTLAREAIQQATEKFDLEQLASKVLGSHEFEIQIKVRATPKETPGGSGATPV